MTLTRRLARPMLASVFIASGIDTLRNPGPRAEMAEPVTTKLASSLPLPDDTEQLVKLNAGVQVVAGTLLAIGRFPRLAAAALAGSLVPTTYAGHRFWEEEEAADKSRQRVQFLKNLGLLGGLILAAFDHDGAPSLGWRARRAAHRVAEGASVAMESLPVG
ncbi:MAG: DoxX family protein [Candidatus Aeolococcus gillhamiae]|uniref:DoxX family protein n=1 Tax=Candidatus Aeolococcus gillhamiae TaxID=3127015 RepID=A0A2W5ZG10_9BACT|nr:MAG: DoxX family protein [Candidatus Dormibacter sp. RRmetagenome_bin12]